MIALTETWNSSVLNVNLENYECFSCPRPKYNKKAKRHSGGIVVYYKKQYFGHIKLISKDSKGVLWLKLNKSFFGCINDIYLCCAYVPPEDSNVYKQRDSPLFEFDYFNLISDGLRMYSELGDIAILGDLNARTGTRADFVENVNLERYLDLPEVDKLPDKYAVRSSLDNHVNNYGIKLLSLCKENNVFIMNGRLEPGKLTSYNLIQRRTAASIVDYCITDLNVFNMLQNMCVHDLTEFSDHCCITFDIFFEHVNVICNEEITYDKIEWEKCNIEELHVLLNDEKSQFDDITNNLLNNVIDIDTCMNQFSGLVFNLSYKLNGKTVKSGGRPCKRTRKETSDWFNRNCKESKNEFYRCKRIYHENPSDANKELFLTARSAFCTCKRKAKRIFYSKEKRTLSHLSKSNPRKFWKYIKKYKNKNNSVNNDVCLDDFAEYFKNMSNTKNDNNFDPDHFSDRTDTVFIESLDCEFTVEELCKTISCLNRHKSADIDNNVADFFIDARDFIAPYLVKIFNYIFERGVYPEAWSRGVIVPIFKKGDRSLPSNYRGITLINVLSKVFSIALRNRINKWCENENVLNEAQFGFRDGRSTSDCVFILHCIIQKVLANKSKLYCCFIDYERAFDTVIHEALWIKLIETGLSCKMVNMVKSIYQNVKSCVKDASKTCYSDMFNVTLGVKQGEPLSPLLFILFVNDVKNVININDLADSDLNLLSAYMLLFADDIVIFTINEESLQALLNNIYVYSLNWGLKINVYKTKICIFEKRKSRCNFIWSINGSNIEVVDSFCYLGIRFYYTGNMNFSVKCLNDQALKAYNNLLSVFSRLNLDMKTMFSMFDSLVAPILLYGSEVWGAYSIKEVDKLHLRFCKNMLGVRSQTSNVAVMGELGRFPLTILCRERLLKQYLKIMKNPNSLMYNVFFDLKSTNILISNNSWALSVKNLLNDLGFAFLYDPVNFDVNTDYFPMLKQRLRDQYLQEWSDTVDNQPKLDYYKKFKTEFCYEKYLDIVDNSNFRKELSRFRLSAHNLEIESGRFENIDRDNRKCKICNINVESEYHFLLVCPKYRDIRRKCCINSSFPSLKKFYCIMSSKKHKTIRNVAKFVSCAMNLRKEMLTAS